MNRAETLAFNRGLLPHFKDWYTRIEYAPGGTVGNPDALLLVDGSLLPVEVKIAKELRNGTFRVKVRPSQILWHNKLSDAGGLSAFFVYDPDEDRCWWFPGWDAGALSSALQLTNDIDIVRIMDWLPDWMRDCRSLLTLNNEVAKSPNFSQLIVNGVAQNG